MPDQDQLHDLLDRWESLRATGHTLSAAELAWASPHLVPELDLRIRALLRMEALIRLCHSAFEDEEER